MNLIIGSGDIRAYLSGTHTKGFAKLLQKFVADDKPYYNSLASPINALRTGAILEQRYLSLLDDSYFIQYKVTNENYDVLRSSIDFAKIENGKIVDFDELKTIWFTEFLDIIIPITELPETEQSKVLKKKFKANFNQVQFQLFCSGLDSANLVFLSANSYEDEENQLRQIKPNEIYKFRIKRDNEVIAKIEERAKFFQHIKNYVVKK